MADEVTLVTRAGNEITASDPGAIGNLIGDGCRIKDPDPEPDDSTEAAAAETPPEPPKRAAKADTQEREGSGK